MNIEYKKAFEASKNVFFQNNDDKQPLIYLILHFFIQNIENLYQTYPYLLDDEFKQILVVLNKIEKQPNIELKKINTSVK